jgi:hypothetical protein
MRHFDTNSKFLQVYPCDRRGIQPTFGSLFPYRNVLPLFHFILIFLGNYESYTHAKHVLLILEVNLRSIKIIFSRLSEIFI